MAIGEARTNGSYVDLVGTLAKYDLRPARGVSASHSRPNTTITTMRPVATLPTFQPFHHAPGYRPTFQPFYHAPG